MFKKIIPLIIGLILILFATLEIRNWDDKFENPGYINFLEGNRLVNEAIDENKMESYKKALEEYKIAMETNEDINIKKNYEIVEKMLQEQENENQQNNEDQKDDQNDQDNKDQQDKQDEQNQDDKNNENNENNEEQQDNQNEENNKDQNNQDNQDNQTQQDDKNQDGENNENQQDSSMSPEELEAQQKEEELKAILQRLEGNEKQAFKNNERVMNMSENKNSENRW